MNSKRCFVTLLAAAAWALAIPTSGRADSVADVTVNTSGLTGTFQIEFQLLDGNGTGDGNNTATLSGFNFGGGASSGTPTLNGNASGDLSTTVTLTDTTFFNTFQQSFTAGSALSFVLDLTTNVDTGGVPDEFSFFILDSSGNNITTADPGGSSVIADINSTTPTVTTFSGTGAFAGLSVTETSATVPEPGTLLLIASGLAGLVAFGRRKTFTLG